MKSGLLYSPLHRSTFSGLLVVNRAAASAAAIATNAEPESRVQKFCTRLPLKLSPPTLTLSLPLSLSLSLSHFQFYTN